MSRSPVERPQCRHKAWSYLQGWPSELCWKIFKKSARDIVLHVALVSSSWVVTVRLYSVRKVKGTIKVDLPTLPVTTPTLSIMKMSRPINHYHLQISVDLHLFINFIGWFTSWLLLFTTLHWFSVSQYLHRPVGFSTFATTSWVSAATNIISFTFLLYEQCSVNRQCPRTDVCELTDSKRDRVFSESF